MKSVDIDNNVLEVGAKLSDKKLSERILNKKERTDRVLAFKSLLQRESAASKKTALEVVGDPFFDKRMKLTAINYLAKFKSEDVVRGLRKTLKTEADPSVKRKATRALGALGDVSALKELQGVRSLEASFARSLISYQNGLPLHYLPMVTTKTFTKRVKNEEVKVSPVSAKEKKEVAAAFTTMGYAKDIYAEPFQKIVCGRNEFMLAAPSKKLNSKVLGKSPTIPLQVLTTNYCPQKVTMAFYVMTHPIPGSKDRVQINLVDKRGQITYTGMMARKGKSWSFSLATSAKAILPAVRVEGTYAEDRNALEFNQFLSATQVEKKNQKEPRMVRQR